METNKLADRIRESRVQAGLTQERLAALLETASGTVSRWERGESEPRGSTLQALANQLHVSPNWLRTGKGTREPQRPVELTTIPEDRDKKTFNHLITEQNLVISSGACNLLGIKYADSWIEGSKVVGFLPESILFVNTNKNPLDEDKDGDQWLIYGENGIEDCQWSYDEQFEEGYLSRDDGNGFYSDPVQLNKREIQAITFLGRLTKVCSAESLKKAMETEFELPPARGHASWWPEKGRKNLSAVQQLALDVITGEVVELNDSEIRSFVSLSKDLIKQIKAASLNQHD